MSRQASIPEHLHNAIVKRWMTGSSANDIVQWIEETNTDRKTPVQTSRTSVQRLLKSVAEGNSFHARLQVVQRARAGAPAIMDALEDVDVGMQACIDEVDRKDAPVDTKRLALKGALLAKRHVMLHRQLKLANIAGEAGDRIQEEFSHLTDRHHEAVQAQDARTEQGIAPEEGETSLLLTVTEPEEVVPEAATISPDEPLAAYASGASATAPTDGVPESIALVSKLISDVIRADFRPPKQRRQQRRKRPVMA